MIDLKPGDRRTWAQLTYTSADSIAGASGGWGVKEQTGNADPAVFALLRDGVTTKIEALVDTPQFPTDAELEARPRRLTYRHVDGTDALWHACPAGQDATGRPGNVYTHAAALTGGEAGLRPIQYWRSSSWLEPFGPVTTSAARLGDLEPGTVVTRASVQEFLAPAGRRDALEAVLAAVDHVVATRRILVLAVEDSDEAARWIGAVTTFTSVGIGRRLGWATFERGHRVTDPANQGLQIVCVPRADIEELQRTAPEEVLILDPAWALAETGREWRTPTQTFPAESLWQSGMVDTLTYDTETVEKVLDTMEEFGAQVGPEVSAQLPLHWPLSMAMLAVPGVDVGDPAELQLACLAEVDLGLLGISAVRAVADQFSEILGGDLAQRNAGHTGPVTGLSYAVERRLVADYLSQGWASGAAAPKVSLGAAELVRDGLTDEIAGVLTAALRQMYDDPQILSVARLVSFLRTGLMMAEQPTRQLESATSHLLGQLSRTDFAATREELDELDPALLAARVPETVPVAVPDWGAPAAPAAPDWAAPAAPAAPLPPAPAPGWGPPAPVAPVAEPPAPVAVGPAPTHRLPDAEDAAVAQLLLEEVGSDRYFGMVDLLRVRLGLRSVPLREQAASEGNSAEFDAALMRFRTSGDSGLDVDVLAGWLTLYAALVEVSRAEAKEPVTQPPPSLIQRIATRSDVSVHEIARYLREATPADAGRLVYWSLHFSLNSNAGALLATQTSRGGQLGISAIEIVRGQMTSNEYAAVLAAVPFDRLKTAFGGTRTQVLLDQIGLKSPSRSRTDDVNHLRK